jgi:hypothetical protein
MNVMKWQIFLVVGACLMGGASCSKSRSGSAQPVVPGSAATGANKKLESPGKTVIVAPVPGMAGRVVSLNAAGQFVVITYEGGQMPTRGQKLNVYRNSLKVGELKATDWQNGPNQVADILTGEAGPGDEVRIE